MEMGAILENQVEKTIEWNLVVVYWFSTAPPSVTVG